MNARTYNALRKLANSPASATSKPTSAEDLLKRKMGPIYLPSAGEIAANPEKYINRPQPAESQAAPPPAKPKKSSVWDDVGGWVKKNPNLSRALLFGLPAFLGTGMVGSMFGSRNPWLWASLFGLGSGIYGYNKKPIEDWYKQYFGGQQ